MEKYNRSGIGNLDARQADEYAKKMKGKESEEEIDKDIKGQRKKRPIFRTKSYADIGKEITKDYKEMESSKNKILSIPDRYKEYR